MKSKIIVAGLLMSSAIALVSTFEKTTHEVHSDCEFTFVALNESYVINESISIPGGFIEIDGNSFISNHLLTYPSGKKSYSSQVVLNETGKYKLEYYYVLDGKYYSESETFIVTSPAFSLGPNSSAYYGVVENSSTPGLIVTLGVNEKIEFNQTINVNSLFESNRFIETFVAPFSRGVADFDTLIFTLTNPINPEEYLKFRVSSSISEPRYVALADVSIQGNGTDYIGEEFYNKGLIHHNDGDGTKVDFSFRGHSFGYSEEIVNGELIRTQKRLENAPYDSTKLRLNFDYGTKSAYVYNPYRADDGSISSITGPGPMRVADLDDPEDVGYRPWNGFSSDFVKVSVSGEEYSNSSARFVINELYGIDLKSTQLNDIIAPTLKLNNKYGSSMPIGKIGYKYQIPEATGEDNIDGKLPVKVNVWKDYQKPTCSSVEIFDNYFIPKTNGNYTVTYLCEDHSGNITTKILKIVVSDDIEPIVIDIDTTGFDLNVIQGKTITLPNASFNGGSGDLDCKIIAKHDDYQETIDNDKTFCPEIEGDWEIDYVVTDFLGQEKVKTLTLNVHHSNLPILQEEFLGDKYIVCHSQYKLPEPKIVDYINNEKITPDYFVDVTLNSTKTRYKKGETINFDDVTHGSKVKFDFVYNETIITSHEATIVNPYNSNAFLIENYFMSDDATICYQDGLTNRAPNYQKGVKLLSKGNETTSFDFANYCLAMFDFKFTLLKNNDHFDSIDITLRDCENKKISITLKITKEKDGFYIAVPGKDPVNFEKLISADFLTIGIKYTNNSIIINNTTIPLSVDDLGKEFKWFPSNKLSVSLCAYNFEASNYLFVNTVGNHEIISSLLNPYDRTAPQLCILDDIRGFYKIGDTVKTSRVIAQDIASSTSSTTVTVINKTTGKYVKDINGTEINQLSCDSQYTIRLEEYADFNFVYSVSESSNWKANNKEDTTITISCVKKDGPKLSFTSYFPETINANTQVKLPQFTVIDSVDTSSITIFRYIIKPSGNIVVMLSAIDSYTFTDIGNYKYCVSARDQYGNISVISQIVKVI